MDVLKYQFTPEEIMTLNEYRDTQTDLRLKVRFIALLMLAEGINDGKVASILGKSLKSIRNWYQKYKSKGIESLNSFQYKPKKPSLAPSEIDQLIKWVKENNPEKLKEVSEYVRENFGITYSNEGIRIILKKKGLKY
mgnify:CR=1 FL=1